MNDAVIATSVELATEAVRFVRNLSVHPERATLITLSGELGAGKTAFTQAVARALGVEERVTSPTFVIEKVYTLPKAHDTKDFSQLVHIDAYRLESGHDLALLGFNELMRDPGALVFLEWPERVATALPTPMTKIGLTVNPDGTRTIFYR